MAMKRALSPAQSLRLPHFSYVFQLDMTALRCPHDFAEVLVGENGVWKYELTLDPIEGGSVTVSLHGANALGADATLVESTFTLNKDVSAAVVLVPSLLRQLLIYDKGTKLAA